MEDTGRDDEGAGDPARAFEDLRAEVAVMRRAVEALPGAWEENRPPDYSPDLGRIVKALTDVGSHLAGIEAHPGLRLTPARFAQEIEQAGNRLVREAVQALGQARQSFQNERLQLSEAVGTAWRKRDIAGLMIALPVLAGLITLAFSPVLLGWLPFGWNTVAAAAIMRDNRWDAGWDLLRAVDPVAAEEAAEGFNLVQANQAALAACREAAEKTGKEQRCTIIVPAQ